MSDFNTHEMASVRLLASTSESETLDRCLQEQIEQGYNSCYDVSGNEQVINVLAKASFVKHLSLQGMPIQQAIRELGKRMRALAN